MRRATPCRTRWAATCSNERGAGKCCRACKAPPRNARDVATWVGMSAALYEIILEISEAANTFLQGDMPAAALQTKDT